MFKLQLRTSASWWTILRVLWSYPRSFPAYSRFSCTPMSRCPQITLPQKDCRAPQCVLGLCSVCAPTLKNKRFLRLISFQNLADCTLFHFSYSTWDHKPLWMLFVCARHFQCFLRIHLSNCGLWCWHILRYVIRDHILLSHDRAVLHAGSRRHDEHVQTQADSQATGI